MDIILHCGEHKTGSTAVQHYLYKNSKKLLKQGVVYHANKLQKNHNSLLYLAGKHDQTPKDASTSVLQEVFATIRSIVKICYDRKPRYLILSAELFFGVDQYEMQIILDRLGLSFNSLRAIIYIRPPVSHFLSMAQEHAKYGSKLTAPDLYRRNILSKLEWWKNYVGHENLILHPFSSQALAKGCIVSDFTEKLRDMTGADITPQAPYTINPSLSAEQAILIQNYRHEFCPQAESRVTLSSLNLLRFFRAVNAAQALPLTKPKLRQEYAEIIEANHQRHLKVLEREFGLTFPGHEPAVHSDVPGQHRCTTAIPNPTIQQLLLPCNQETLALLEKSIPEYGESLPRLLYHMLFRHEQTRGNLSFALALAAYRARDFGRGIMERLTSYGAIYKYLNAAFISDRALKRDPDFLHAQGAVLRDKGELDNAAASLKKALTLAPDKAETHVELGAVQLKQQKPDKALKSLHKALELGEQSPKAYTTLGRIHISMGQPETAEEACAKALELAPASPDPHVAMARTLLRQGKFDLAESHIHKALELKANSGVHHYLLGLVQFKTGRQNAAYKSLENALTLDDTREQVYSFLAKTLVSLDKLEDAAATLQKGLDNHPESYMLHLQQGQLLLQMAELEAAYRSLRYCTQLKPSACTAWRSMATCLQRLGKMEEAAAALGEAERVKQFQGQSSL